MAVTTKVPCPRSGALPGHLFDRDVQLRIIDAELVKLYFFYLEISISE